MSIPDDLWLRSFLDNRSNCTKLLGDRVFPISQHPCKRDPSAIGPTSYVVYAEDVRLKYGMQLILVLESHAEVNSACAPCEELKRIDP